MRLLRGLWPWLLVLVLGAPLALALTSYLAKPPELVWRYPRAAVLASGAVLAAVLVFHVRRSRAAALAFSQTPALRTGWRGRETWADLPGVMRVLALAVIALASARPQTYRTTTRKVDSIDIMIVFDLSRSMEETDLPRHRLDAAQRVVRNFVRRNDNDRIGLVVFAQQAMLQCPLTHDSRALEQIVADLQIGDVPENGTAIGDGLALAVAQLRRSEAKSRVVILLSDGDSNTVTRFSDGEAARAARQLQIKVYTVLVGAETTDLFGGMSVNPENLRSIAATTGGLFFRADDEDSFRAGFARVRDKLEATKREVKERKLDRELAGPLVLVALALLALEVLLSATWLRRLP